MFKSFIAESIKLKHSPVWLVFLILPVIPAIMGTFNYIQNIGILNSQWYSLWTQHTIFTCYFFMPSIIGIYCSYLWRLEHTNHNWNAAMTAPVPIRFIYLSKLLVASLMVLLTQAWIGMLFIISGKLCGLTAPIPLQLPIWLLCGFLGTTVICALQLLISLIIRSFAVPVGIALIGGISGLAMLTKGYGIYFPYSFLTLGMHSNNPSGAMECNLSQFIISCIIYLLIFSTISILWIKKRDVVAG